MKTRKIILEITPAEAYDLAYAMEDYIKNCVEGLNSIKLLDWNDMKDECDILQYFVDDGYLLYLKTKSFKDYDKPYRNVDEWYKALVKKRKRELSTSSKKEHVEITPKSVSAKSAPTEK